MDRITQRTWARLAGGCAAWVALAFGRTERMAGIVGTTPSEIHALGVRDAGSGLLLSLARDPRLPLAARVACPCRTPPATAAGVRGSWR